MDSLIQIIARHRWEAVVAMVIVVTTHGLLLNDVRMEGSALTGSIGTQSTVIGAVTPVACDPLFQYAAPGQDVAVTAQAPGPDVVWQAPDAQSLHTDGLIAVVQYGANASVTTHRVSVSLGGQTAECLVIIK